MSRVFGSLDGVSRSKIEDNLRIDFLKFISMNLDEGLFVCGYIEEHEETNVFRIIGENESRIVAQIFFSLILNVIPDSFIPLGRGLGTGK